MAIDVVASADIRAVLAGAVSLSGELGGCASNDLDVLRGRLNAVTGALEEARSRGTLEPSVALSALLSEVVNAQASLCEFNQLPIVARAARFGPLKATLDEFVVKASAVGGVSAVGKAFNPKEDVGDSSWDSKPKGVVELIEDSDDEDDDDDDTSVSDVEFVDLSSDDEYEKVSESEYEIAPPPWYGVPHEITARDIGFGSGSFGTVHFETWKSPNVDIVKTADDISHRRTLENFVKEVEVWNNLKQFHLSNCSQRYRYSVISEGSCRSLHDYICSTRTTRAQTWKSLHQVALGLQYLHSKGIVHGDLKSNDIVVQDRPTPIADFGLSWLRKGTTSMENTAPHGTLRWRAPECFFGVKPQFSSDVYSFAMCIYEALTERPPYSSAHDTTVETARGVLPPRQSRLSDTHYALLRRMTAYSPSERCSLAEVISSLRSFADEEKRVGGGDDISATHQDIELFCRSDGGRGLIEDKGDKVNKPTNRSDQKGTTQCRQRGSPSALLSSCETVFRRKVCIVGPSMCGKTSLVKSIISKNPFLASREDRTVGIEYSSLPFDNTDPRTKREASIFDFAGQDAYHTSYTVFFSRRTVFFVCIDLQSYSTALTQALVSSEDQEHFDELMDVFIEANVKCWIRLITARQPDADFVFVATKSDTLSCCNSDAVIIAELDLRKRLLNVLASLNGTKRSVAKSMSTLTDGEPTPLRLIRTSCTSIEDVIKSRDAVFRVLLDLDGWYSMPPQYSQVLEAVRHLRPKTVPAEGHPTLCLPASSIVDFIQQRVPCLNVDATRSLLESLHDLSDVLWLHDLDFRGLEDMVILDPLLLIDFIREVVVHTNADGFATNGDIRNEAPWCALDKSSTLMMKHTLQALRLVHPGCGEMTWDSDLIVPSFWRASTRKSCFDSQIKRDENRSVCIRWDYKFANYVPDALFDQLVVATYSSSTPSCVGPNYIVIKDSEDRAWQILVKLAPKNSVLHFEAILLERSSDTQISLFWESFRHAFVAIERVLGHFRGVSVTRYALDSEDRAHDLDGPYENVMSAKWPDARQWLPPRQAMNMCRAIMQHAY